jgi:hypothetical protein
MTQPTSGPRPRVYVAFDDTDNLGADRGTGKVGRWFADDLPAGVHPWAVVRQQLLVHPDVPYTSHNSSAVCVLEVDASLWPATPSFEDGVLADLVERACRHVERHQLPGSDPGVCVAWEGSPSIGALTAFGRRAAVEVVTQAAARTAAEGAHLSGHGGTDDGIIGAAAGVGLTAEGWHGRLIEYRVALRDFPDPVSVGDLEAAGIAVVTVDRDAPVPGPDALVATGDWLRPRLLGGRPVLPIQRDDGAWVALAPRTVMPPEQSAGEPPANAGPPAA